MTQPFTQFPIPTRDGTVDRNAVLSARQASEEARDAAQATALAVVRHAPDNSRPGEAPFAFGETLTGLPGDVVPTARPTAADASLGVALRVVDAETVVAPRQPVAVMPGRIYEFRARLRRVSDPVNPLNDAIETGVQWLPASMTGGSVQTLETLALEVADGVHVSEGETFSLDLSIADHVIPAGTTYARPFVRTYGTDSEARIGEVALVDVTEQPQIADGSLVLPAATITARVPTDYPDIADALNALWRRFGAGYQPVNIIIETGHEISAPFQCSGKDFGNFAITSEAAEVKLAASFVAERAFEFLDGSVAPQWGFILDCDGKAQIGHYLGNGSRGVVLPGCGVRKATVTGFRVIDGSSLSARPNGTDGIVSTDNGRSGVWVTRNSQAALYFGDLRRNGVSADHIGFAALYLSRGSIVNADRANLSESGYGVRIARSWLAARQVVAENLVKGAITAFENASVSMSFSNFNGSGDGTAPIIAMGVPGSSRQGNAWVNVERSTFDDCDGDIIAGANGTILIADAKGVNIRKRFAQGSRLTVHAPGVNFSAHSSNTMNELITASRSCYVNLAASQFNGGGGVRNLCRVLHNSHVEAQATSAANFTESFARVEAEGWLYCDSTTFDGDPVASVNRSSVWSVENDGIRTTRMTDGTQIVQLPRWKPSLAGVTTTNAVTQTTTYPLPFLSGSSPSVFITSDANTDGGNWSQAVDRGRGNVSGRSTSTQATVVLYACSLGFTGAQGAFHVEVRGRWK